MSIHQDTANSLPPQSAPVYLTAVPAAEIVGIDKATLARHVQPDAMYESLDGKKRWPLWLRTTVETYRDERQGGAL
ncbi:MAG: hypothetical protein M0030_13070 [Actinomycetota bacterium]|nr:hypothetical protein [Actinomycetota bacterium]